MYLAKYNNQLILIINQIWPLSVRGCMVAHQASQEFPALSLREGLSKYWLACMHACNLTTPSSLWMLGLALAGGHDTAIVYQ